MGGLAFESQTSNKATALQCEYQGFTPTAVTLISCCSLCLPLQPEEELDPEERDNFLQQLYKFMEDRGTLFLVALCVSLCTVSAILGVSAL